MGDAPHNPAVGSLDTCHSSNSPPIRAASGTETEGASPYFGPYVILDSNYVEPTALAGGFSGVQIVDKFDHFQLQIDRLDQKLDLILELLENKKD